MSTTLTAAIYRASLAGKLQERTKPPAPSPVPPAAKEAATSKLMQPTVGEYPGPCSWVLGRGQVGAHLPRLDDPERLRLVLRLPADEALVAAVIGAIENFYTSKP